MKCYRPSCEVDEGCNLAQREAHLKRIKPACIQQAIAHSSKPSSELLMWEDNDRFAWGGLVALRAHAIELPPMGIRQALELLSNGDCASDK